MHRVWGDNLMTSLAQIHERFRQDRYERQLYGADVVDAYIDLNNIRRFIQRRLSYLPAKWLAHMGYAVLDIADTGGIGG